MARNHTLVFIDGSHYDRLRTALETPLDLRKLVDVAVNGRFLTGFSATASLSKAGGMRRTRRASAMAPI